MPSPPLSIVQSLSPRVAVLASDDVADSCAANGCNGLDELLRPWEGGTERVSILSTTLTPTVQPTFPLRFVSYASVYSNPTAAVPSPDVVMDQISSVVGRHSPDEEQHYPLTRALLLSSRPLAPHETFNHPVGVLFAVSTTTPDPLATLQRLHGQAVGTGAQAAPWMDGVQVLKFFLVVHDVSKAGASLEQANELLAAVKKAYGPHSTLLVINSREEPVALDSPSVQPHASFAPTPPPMDDPNSLSQLYANTMASLSLSPMTAVEADSNIIPSETPQGEDVPPPLPPKVSKRYAQKLTPDDVNRLIAVVRELVVQSLVPWMEARVREWNETYQSNKRGITGRLFGAGRKLFGNSRPSSPSPSGQTGYNAVKGYYPASSIDALSRRLADFAFMLRDYRYAAGIYDNLRRDFAQDRAFRYAAAATEMYGLSQLLSHTYFLPNTPPSAPATFTTLQHSEISSWLEQAVMSYSARGGPQLDALRITVLYYEAWKAINEWRGVGTALVRSAGEADEVPCAVIVEEAASADVKGGKSKRGRRRQALHLVMAARRYEKSGLKMYSRRCLERAAYLLRDAPWTAVRDRVEYSLGRQAYTLGESAVAVEHFLRLLQREDTAASGSQGMVLEDMALAYEQLQAHPEQLAAAGDKLRLPTPVLDVTKTRLVLPSEGSSTSGDWAALDALALASWDRKGKKPMSVLPNPKTIVAGLGETLLVELLATNPLNAPVLLADLTLQVEGEADVELLNEVSLEPYETRCVALSLTPKAAGPVTVKSASFRFHGFLPVVESLERRGRRLQATKAQRLTPTYAKDTTLTVHVEAAAPRIAAELSAIPSSVFAGEIIAAEIQLRNSGTVAVEDVQLVTNHYGVLTLADTQHSDIPTAFSNVIAGNKPITLHAGTIAPGESVAVPVTFMALVPGKLDLLALVVFATPDGIAGSTGMSHSAEVKRVLSLYTEVEAAKKGYFVSCDVSSHTDSLIEISALQPVSPYWDAKGSSSAAKLYANQSARAVLRVVESGREVDLQQANLVGNLGRLLLGDAEHLAPIEPATVSLPASAPYVLSRRAYRLSFGVENFPTLSGDVVRRLLPLFDPLDLDLLVTWTMGSRHGIAVAHGVRPAPRASLVETLRVDDGPAKRTMYEETGRLRRALADSILEGPYAAEDDPLVIRAFVPGAKGGRAPLPKEYALFYPSDSSGLLPLTIQLQNRSPILSVRWIVRLPPPKAGQAALFTGELNYRGTIAPGESVSVDTNVWAQPGLVSMAGWEVERETGGDVSGDWIPRASWASVGSGPVVEVLE